MARPLDGSCPLVSNSLKTRFLFKYPEAARVGFPGPGAWLAQAEFGTAGRLGSAIQLRSGEKMPGQSPGRGLSAPSGGFTESLRSRKKLEIP